MRKVKNGIFVILAFLCVGIGAIGIILPILPTTPFLLLAAVLFAKGSKRFHIWFLSTKLYKNHLDDFVRTKAVTLKTKITILSCMSIFFILAMFLAPIWHAKAAIGLVAAFHFYYFIFRIRTISLEEKRIKKLEKNSII